MVLFLCVSMPVCVGDGRRINRALQRWYVLLKRSLRINGIPRNNSIVLLLFAVAYCYGWQGRKLIETCAEIGHSFIYVLKLFLQKKKIAKKYYGCLSQLKLI